MIDDKNRLSHIYRRPRNVAVMNVCRVPITDRQIADMNFDNIEIERFRLESIYVHVSILLRSLTIATRITLSVLSVVNKSCLSKSVVNWLQEIWSAFVWWQTGYITLM